MAHAAMAYIYIKALLAFVLCDLYVGLSLSCTKEGEQCTITMVCCYHQSPARCCRVRNSRHGYETCCVPEWSEQLDCQEEDILSQHVTVECLPSGNDNNNLVMINLTEHYYIHTIEINVGSHIQGNIHIIDNQLEAIGNSKNTCELIPESTTQRTFRCSKIGNIIVFNTSSSITCDNATELKVRVIGFTSNRCLPWTNHPTSTLYLNSERARICRCLGHLCNDTVDECFDETTIEAGNTTPQTEDTTQIMEPTATVADKPTDSIRNDTVRQKRGKLSLPFRRSYVNRIQLLLLEYRFLRKTGYTEWKQRNITVRESRSNRRQPRTTDDDTEDLEVNWTPPLINTRYQIKVTPFTDEGPGDTSDPISFTSDCSAVDDVVSQDGACDDWCVCTSDENKYCLKTCDHCYSCEEEPEFPTEDDVEVSLSKITHNAMTLNIQLRTDELLINGYQVIVRVYETEAHVRTDNITTSEKIQKYTDLKSNTTYVFLVHPLWSHGVETFIAFPIIVSASTKQQSSSTHVILIISIVAAVVFLVTIVLVAFIVIKVRRNKQNAAKKHMDENYYNNAVNSNTYSESPTKKEQSEPEVKLEITEKPRPAIPIKIEDLQSYITANKNKVGGLEDEFNQIPSNKEATTAEGDMPENYDKNRFTNIRAYDHSRVVLYLLPRDPRSTYINASYISSYSKRKQFIASQAPRTSTVDDMWRMIWQKEINSIVMLTNLKEGTRVKSHQYWPSRGERNYGDVSVSMLSTSEFAFYTERHFVVALGNKQRHVTHMQFTSWPDHGVPKTPTEFLEFYYKVKSLDRKRTGPLLVHCSAGVGRTGTFIAVDYLLEQSRIEGVVDVFACVATMRRDRVDMVQTEQQYRFIYETLREALYIGPTAVPVADYDVTAALMTSRKKDQSQLQKEFKLLNDMFPPVELSKENSTYDGSLPPQTRDTSDSSTGRSSNTDDRMVYVSGKEVLSAVLCDSYREKSSTIISQIPTYQQAEHFWHLLVQHQVCGVVLLDDIPEEHQYWPKLESPDRFTSHLIVRTASISEDRETGVVERNFEMIEDATRSTKVIPVRQWQIKSWIKGTVFSDHCKAMMKIKSDMHQWAGSGDRAGSRVLVQCGTGLDKSAMFVALCCAVDKVEIDRMVDVAFAVKFLRQSKKSAVATYEQYKELHQAMELVTDEKGEYYNTASVAE